MAFMTYHDLDGSAPRVEWQGIKFLDGQSVEVTDAHILAKAETNAFFSVEASEEAGEPTEAPRRGRRPKAEDSADA